MARDRVLPGALGRVSRRYATPVQASLVVGVLAVGLAWVYLLATSVQSAFNDVVAVSGLLFAVFYIFTALATIIYYRRLMRARAWDAVTHSRSGAGGVNRRPTRSTGRAAARSGTVVRTRLPRRAPARPSSRISRSTVHLGSRTFWFFRGDPRV